MMTDEMPPIGMDENRLRHCRGVGVRASELGCALFGWSDEKCREMFVMGYLHDIGYQFAHEQSEHEELGGDLLRSLGFTYWAEIFHHGNPDSAYQSNELLVLNLADMLTSKDGSATTIPARLEDIASRYGVESTQYVAAKRLAEVLVAQVQEIEGSQSVLSQLISLDSQS